MNLKPNSSSPLKCIHQLSVAHCDVCQKEIEAAIKFIILKLLKQPTAKELGKFVEKTVAENPNLSQLLKPKKEERCKNLL